MATHNNASAYSDIQELMCVAEVIVTYYSSCMADFALQHKVGFLFTPDVKEYEAVHPLCMRPEQWPDQIALNNIELINNIINYDADMGLTKMKDFFARIGNCDEGHAVESLIKVMDEHRVQD